jgi:hypothetical protein
MDPLVQRLASLKQRAATTQDADSSDLARKRYQNDLHLKGTLDHIYEKYSRDFSEVADEVDIRTGEVVVNRGHVQHMRGETDTGIEGHWGPQRSWIGELVDDVSEVEPSESDEDELCICPSKSSKATGVRDTSKGVIESTEVINYHFSLSQ